MTNNIQYYAQFGEDKALHDIFKKTTDGICVEVGGYDGITGSNTYFFEKLGWKCLIVEPMPTYCEKIKKARRCDLAEIAASDTKGEVTFYIAQGVETLSTMEQDANHFERMNNEGAKGIKEIKVKTDLLANILEERGINQIDFLTLDVEGHELRALKGMPLERLKPRILIIEDNSFGTDNKIKKYMENYNYVRFKRTGCNDWYTQRNDPLASLTMILITETTTILSTNWRIFKKFIKKNILKI